MRLSGIKMHLRPYSIFQRRKTTINHAFASALAPCDEYDQHRLNEAMVLLGQSDSNNLHCVYCHSGAETWDHLVGLVKDAELYGYGHQIGNLVPCCRACNSLKGNRDWRVFLQSAQIDPETRALIQQRLETYLETYAVQIDLERARSEYPDEWGRYNEIKREILLLMEEADSLATRLRSKRLGAA